MAVLLKEKAPYILGCVLLSSAVLLGTGCSNEGSDGATDQTESASLLEKTTAAATAVVDEAKNAVEETAAAARVVATDAKTAVTETTDKAVAVTSDVKEAVVETTDKAATVVSDAKTAIAEKTEAVKQVVVAKETAPAVDGAKVYASCSGCHGVKAEGGVGPNLNAQASSAVIDKLNRYKAGEQIGPMSGMMTPIAKGLSDAEIKAVSEYVVTLK